jgi:hypothetical protein
VVYLDSQFAQSENYSAGPGNSAIAVAPTGCCGHSVAAFTASTTRSLIFDPNASGTGTGVFTATP